MEEHHSLIHGMSQSPEFRTWSGILNRCYRANEEIESVKIYRLKGVAVCSRWKISFVNFYEDMGPRPEGKYPSGKPKYSIDRIDNDGNYSCGYCDECLEMGWTANCRWADKFIQSRNRKLMKTTRLPGVNVSKKKFTARIMIDNKRIYLGTFDTEAEASTVYLAKREELLKEINE